MTFWMQLLLTSLALPLSLVQGAALPADADGWRAARWGMTASELERAFDKRLVRLPGKRVYGGAYASLALEGVMLGGRRFRALFQMNSESERLQQVLLEPVSRPGQEAQFYDTLAELEGTYGAPDGSCIMARRGGQPLSVELWWRSRRTTAHLTFFDFYTRSMVFEDPNRDRNQLIPYYKIKRNNPRFLPRRTLVRFHPTARTDLMAAACPAEIH